MRLCANENIAVDIVARLRQAGHDVLWIRESAPGSTDASVLARAQSENRIVMTFDKDFGALVFHQGSLATHGVILLRLSQPSPGAVADRVCAILASRSDWEGNYSVIDDTTIRMRELPHK